MRKDIHEYYRALGLNPGASPAEIKRAYRQLIQRWHPDHFKSGSLMQTTAEDLTKEINEAYEQLFKKQLHKKFAPKGEPRRAATKSPFAPSPGSRRRSEAATDPRAKPAAPPPTPVAPRRARRWQVSQWPWIRLVLALGVIAGGYAIWPVGGPAGPARRVAAATMAESDPARVTSTSAVRITAKSFPPPAAVVRGGQTPSSRPVAPVAVRPMWVAEVPSPFVPRPTAEWDRMFEAAAVLLKTFERGDSRARVIAVQGPPDDSGENIIRYGSSVVYFRDGLVTGWSDRLPHLRVRSMLSAGFDLLETFGAGSTRADVERLQGRPTDSVFGAYFYGSSVIRFDQDRVSHWTEGSDSLRTPPMEKAEKLKADH